MLPLLCIQSLSFLLQKNPSVGGRYFIGGHEAGAMNDRERQSIALDTRITATAYVHTPPPYPPLPLPVTD